MNGFVRWHRKAKMCIRDRLGGKNLFQKAAHQFGRTVESIQIGFHVVPQVVVLVAPTLSLIHI